LKREAQSTVPNGNTEISNNFQHDTNLYFSQPENTEFY